VNGGATNEYNEPEFSYIQRWPVSPNLIFTSRNKPNAL